MSWTAEDVDKAFIEVKKKALVDQAFRNLVISNPHQAIEQVTGRAVPANFRIKVVESDPNYTFTFVLPEPVPEELSEEALDRVAGGIACVIGAEAAAGACAAAISMGGCGAYACAADADVR